MNSKLKMNKKCKTCKKLFFCKPSKVKTQIFCSRKCASNNIEVKDRMMRNQLKTFIKKYNGHPMKTKNTYDAFKISMLKNHNVDHPSKSLKLIEKSRITKKSRYNDENYNNVKKQKQTTIKKYGVDNIRKSITFNKKISNDKKSKTIEKIIENLKHEKISWKTVDCYKNDFELHQLKCNVCDSTFYSTMHKYKNIKCYKCNKIDVLSSIYEFLISIIPANEIEKNNTSILYNKSVDFYVPFKKIGIDIVKLESATNKNYMLNKLKACASHGICLIQIFEDEWLQQTEIVKSMLCKILNVNVSKIDIGDKNVRELSNEEKNNFLTINHIQSTDKSSIRLGLFSFGELISIMTFCKSRRNKLYEYEILRYTDKLYTEVYNSAKTLLNYFIEKYKPISLICYNDRRYTSNDLYVWLNFQFVKNTSPSYYYISLDKKHRHNWIIFQKSRLKNILEKYNHDFTEHQNMQLNNFDVLYDCGQSIWTIT